MNKNAAREVLALMRECADSAAEEYQMNSRAEDSADEWVPAKAEHGGCAERMVGR